nr:PHB depolymerase family esterase [Polymorphobacter sp.]
MRNLGDTIGRLAARQKPAPSGRNHLPELTGFGTNPGALNARSFIPADLASGAPLVVILHGCTQTAADYDHGAGWSTLAAEQGFALLFPEQARANNANLCFNWFAAEDIRRGHGEVESIRQMIDTMAIRHGLDRGRIFITGLSAGGAMALAMLATHPELFAAGAIIAGVPYATAHSVPEAFDRMRGQGLPKPVKLESLLRTAAPIPACWPRLSVWQGTADTTVVPANADAIIAGWTALHGNLTARTESLHGQPHRLWRNTAGHDVVESITISGMAHGTPIAAHGPEACGTPGPFMLDVGISSTRRIAAFWGIAPAVAAAAATTRPAPPTESGIEAIINTALRQAGLMR